jgi:hypothetical protein
MAMLKLSIKLLALLFIIPVVVHSAVARLQAESVAAPNSEIKPSTAAEVRLGDVMMRSLRVWPQRTNTNDTLAAAEAFKVDRIVWIYENTQEFNEQVRAMGIGIGTTMAQNAREHWINDLSRSEQEAFVDRFTVVNLDGEQVIRAHRTRFGRDHLITHFEPDQSNPEWLELYTDYVVSLYEQGIDTLHRDDPRITVGSILSGGSFTDSAVAFVRNYLIENFTSQELRELGVENPDTFNIRDHFKALGAPTDGSLWTWRGSPLMAPFHDALMEADRQFYLQLKPEVEARAGYSVPWSLNGMGPMNPHEEAFDFRIGEFQSHFNQPQTILLLNEFMRRAGKKQAFISIVDRNWETNETFVSDLRRHIPSAYASGAIPLVPWCMYMHAAPRYYGTVEEYGDLYHFVSANRHYFDEHELLSVSGIDTRARLYSWMPNREMVYDEGNPAVRVWVNEPNVIGYVRRKPGAGHAVIHLVDWNETPAPFEVTFDPLALVDAPAADVRVLQPKAEPIVIKGYQGRTLELPALDPWALLVVTPAATPSADLPEPRLTAPLRGVVPAGTVAKFTDPGEGRLIMARYLADGGEGNPQFVSLGNHASLNIPAAGVLEAMTRHVGSGQESAVVRVRFETFEDYSAEPHEWAGRSGIDLSDRFRVTAGEILVNGSFLAEEMQLMGNKVERGFSSLGNVLLMTPVEPEWEIFTVRVGIDDAEDRRPCARFQVMIDGELAYETPIINPTKQQIADELRVEYSIAVRIPQGAERLQLRAINGGFFENQNHLIWAEPTVYMREGL